MEKNRHEEIFPFPDFQEINPKNKSTLKSMFLFFRNVFCFAKFQNDWNFKRKYIKKKIDNEEKKQSYHLNLLNKLTTESTKMSSKQKKVKLFIQMK